MTICSRSRRDQAIGRLVTGVDREAPTVTKPMSAPPVAGVGRGVPRSWIPRNLVRDVQVEVPKRGFHLIHFAAVIGAGRPAAGPGAPAEPAGIERVALAELPTADREGQAGLVRGREVQAGRVVTWVPR